VLPPKLHRDVPIDGDQITALRNSWTKTLLELGNARSPGEKLDALFRIDGLCGYSKAFTAIYRDQVRNGVYEGREDVRDVLRAL
jgi:hypothetical protein